jgi:hypothetical protein
LQGAARLADIAENTAGIWELHERALVTKPVPNFTRLDPSRPDIAFLMNAMLRAREVVAARLMSLTILSRAANVPGKQQSAALAIASEASGGRVSARQWLRYWLRFK